MNPLAYVKLGIATFAILLIAFFAYKVNSWRQDALQLGAVRQEMVQLKAAQAAAQKASEGYQIELQNIRKRPVVSGPVRLCIKRKPMPSDASGPGSAAAASGVVPSGNGEDHQEGADIAGDLAELARRADEVTAQARALQNLRKP